MEKYFLFAISEIADRAASKAVLLAATKQVNPSATWGVARLPGHF
jgi:hypothetical protein